MNDQRIDELLKMASGADALERDLFGDVAPVVRVHAPAGRSGVGRRLKWGAIGAIGVGGALAAAWAVMFLVTGARPEKAVTGPAIAEASVPIPAAANQDASSGEVRIVKRLETGAQQGAAGQRHHVVLALFEGTDPETGEACPSCECVQWWDHELESGQTVRDVRPGELLGASMGMSCMPTPRRVTVVGLSGPAADLPDTDAEAESIVRCVLQSPSTGGVQCADRELTLASSGAVCLPASVDVRVQTWGR